MFARVPLERVRDNPFQMRVEYGDVGEIAASLLKLRDSRPETSGLIQVPLGRVVLGEEVSGKGVLDREVLGKRVLDIREYGGVLACLGDEPGAWVELAAGHRRFRAFQELHEGEGGEDFATFPVEVQVLSDQVMADIAWEENARRKDLSAVEEGQAIQRAMDEFGYSLGDVAERWGLSKSAVCNKVRLLELPEKVQGLVQSGHLSERHARELLPLVQVARAPQAAASLARRAVTEDMSASVLNNRVACEVQKRTRQVPPEMLEWEDWGDVPLPEECNITCKGCPREVRGKCSNPKLYNEKAAVWQRRLACLASQKTGLPVLTEGVTIDSPTLRYAQEHECKHLGVLYRDWAYQGVLVDGDLPGVYYACKRGWQCDCVKAERQAEVEADPQQSEYQKWEEAQETRAREIVEETLLYMEASFRSALNWMPGDDYLRLFVAMVKGASLERVKVSADVDSVARALAVLVCGSGDYTRVGRAMVHRAEVYHLAGLAPATDEVEGHLQVLRDLLKERELTGRNPAPWRYGRSLDRAREVLEALPGHEELRGELARLGADIEAAVSQEEGG